MRRAERHIDEAGLLGRPLDEPAAATAPPVLLIPGYGSRDASMSAIARSLTRDGFRVSQMTPPEDGFGDVRRDAEFVLDHVQALAASSCAAVDLVGHSRGGLVARAARQLLGDKTSIGRVITIASVNRGVPLGYLRPLANRVLPGNLRQYLRDESLIDELHATRAGVDLVSIGTLGFDGVVSEPVSRIDGSPFIAVDEGRTIGPLSRLGHYHLLRDDVTYEAVRDALLRSTY